MTLGSVLTLTGLALNAGQVHVLHTGSRDWISVLRSHGNGADVHCFKCSTVHVLVFKATARDTELPLIGGTASIIKGCKTASALKAGTRDCALRRVGMIIPVNAWTISIILSGTQC